MSAIGEMIGLEQLKQLERAANGDVTEIKPLEAVDQAEGPVYSQADYDMIMALPKVPVLIPHPDYEADYEPVWANGVPFKVPYDEFVMVPTIVKEILDNARASQKLVSAKIKLMQKRMRAPIEQIPSWTGNN